jgi:hypothetical protein
VSILPFPRRPKHPASQAWSLREFIANVALLLLMKLLLLPIVIATLYGQVSVKDFGAKGDGIADDTRALQNALDAGCGSAKLRVPAGTYNISSPLVTKCAMSTEGDGPGVSIIVQTAHGTLNHGIVASYALTLRDLAINTEPLTTNKGMVAVFRSDLTPGAGQIYAFQRFNSSGSTLVSISRPAVSLLVTCW